MNAHPTTWEPFEESMRISPCGVTFKTQSLLFRNSGKSAYRHSARVQCRGAI